jgi:hypothetical protein
MTRISALLVVLSAALLDPIAFATVYHVGSGGDFAQIQAAIDAAVEATSSWSLPALTIHSF